MNQSRIRAVFIVSALVIGAMLVFGNSASATVTEPSPKEYRNASTIVLNGRTHLLVTNGTAVEILQFNQASALVPVAELHLPQKIKDVVTVTEGKESFAIVTTGRFLYRVRITDPQKMEVVLKRDVYQYSRGRIHTGSVESLATNGKVLITGGQFGVRAMGLTNLSVEKFYHYEKTYGVAVNNQVVFVLGETKAFAYHLSTGKKLMETNIKNADKQIRRPAVNKQNGGFVISDNEIIKMFENKTASYKNPEPKMNFSYAVAVTNQAVYYANGYGITKLDNNLKKISFLKTATKERNWAVGILTAEVNGSEKVIVLNKSNILVLSPNLAVISQYKSAYDFQNNPQFRVEFDHKFFMTNQTIVAHIVGFWPNETVKLKIAKKFYQVKANNFGQAVITFVTPSTPGKYVIDINAVNSGTNYQESRDIR